MQINDDGDDDKFCIRVSLQCAGSCMLLSSTLICIKRASKSDNEFSFQCIYSTPWVKKQDTKLFTITSPNVDLFSKFFTDRLNGKFATNAYLNIPSHLKCVAILPCGIWMTENYRQSEICIVINDKSPDSTVTHLSCDGFFITNLSFNLLVKEFLKSVKNLAKLQAKWLIMSHALFALDFCPQRCRTRQKSKIICV